MQYMLLIKPVQINVQSKFILKILRAVHDFVRKKQYSGQKSSTTSVPYGRKTKNAMLITRPIPHCT